jgi:hypothetical protein
MHGKMVCSNTIDVDTLQLGELVTSQSGAKTCALTARRCDLLDARVHGGAVGAEGILRPRVIKGVSLPPGEPVQRQLGRLDDAIMSLARANSMTLFRQRAQHGDHP